MNWLTRFFSRRSIYRDLSEELQAHLDERITELMDAGVSRKEAEHAARREFGNVTLIERQGRETWQWLLLENFLADLRFAFRSLRKNLSFSLTSVFVLGLGLAACISIFAFVDAALIQPLPYKNLSRLVAVYESIQMIPRSNLSYADYQDWKKQNIVFEAMDAWTGNGYLLRTPSGMKPVPGARVTDGFFRTLGVKPALGRDFYSGEDRPAAAPTVILTYAAWQNRFGARPDIIGQNVTLSDTAYTIIGVLPRDFHFALSGQAELWTTLRTLQYCEKRRGCHNLYGVARLKDNISIETASTEIKGIAQQLQQQYPDTNRGQDAAIVPLKEAIVGKVRPLFMVLLAGAGLLLLIACANISSLLLVRSESRRREIAVRNALGASRLRLLVQFIAEGSVLVVASATLAFIASAWLIGLIVSLIPAEVRVNVPFLSKLGLNLHVFVFGSGLTLVAAALFCLTPALNLSLQQMKEGLAEGSRGSAGNAWRRLGSKLVVVELAIAVTLLVGAGLLGKSFYRLLHVELGFQPSHLAALDVIAPASRFAKEEQIVTFARTLVDRISSLPGVAGVGITSKVVLSGNGNTTWIRFAGRPYHGEHNEVNEREVSPKYFTALQAPLISGRNFAEADDASKPRVVIINQSLARQYFAGENPIGKQIADIDLKPASVEEIVGVVKDVREGSLDAEIWPAIYEPFNQHPDTYLSLVIRTSQSEDAALPMIEAAIRDFDPDLAMTNESTMNQAIDESPTAYLYRSSAGLVGGFAALALLLSVVGLYGVVAYSVSQRTREIGVRMALGAQRRSVVKMILREAGRLTVVGIVAGLGCAVGAAALMRGVLFGVQSWDIPTLGAVAVTLAVSAMLASYLPARRASNVEPVVALRHE
jgi:predicted permease